MIQTFKRTKSGLKNQHFFHDVDLVVFLEGGSRNHSKTDVYSGSYNSGTNDIIFWRNIFDRLKPGKKIKYKSVGSKTTVRDIAMDVVDGKMKTVYVAMDSEFDELLSKKIVDTNVIYSYGYSWENDVWNETVIKEILKELSGITIAEKAIENNFKKFLNAIKLAVIADAYLFSKDLSFFPKTGGILFCVDCKPVDLPCIQKPVIEKKLKDNLLKKTTLYSFARKREIDPKKNCYGHFFADYCCQLILHYLQNRLKLPGVQKAIFYRMALNKFFQHSFADSAQFDYYKNCLA